MPLQIFAVDSVPGQTFTYTATGLPSGLSINSSTGIITGTPSAQGTFNTVITATDTLGVTGSTAFTWFILPGGGNIVTVNSPGNQSNTVNVTITNLQITATDSASGQTLTYTATGLPTGLSISGSGLISGTPTATGNYVATVTATDTTLANGSVTFNWAITGGSGNVITVTSPGNQTNNVGSIISLQIAATDSASGQTLTFSATGLPTGLGISSSGLITGTIGGSPRSYSVVVTATDTTTAHGSTSFTWIVPAANVVTVTNPGSQSTKVGNTVGLQIAAVDSASGQTLSFSATSLPAGLTINTSGFISGSPTTVSSNSVTVKAVDTTGASGTATFNWTITSAASIPARVGMSVPNQAFKTVGFYAFGRTQDAADATCQSILSRPRSQTPPLAVKKFWNGGNPLTNPVGSGPGDYHLSNNFNNMTHYVNDNTRVVVCIRPYFIRANEKDSNGTHCNYRTSSQLTSAQNATAEQEYQNVVSWLAALSTMGFPSTRLRVVLWQEPANGANHMLSTDYNNMIRTYGPAINSSSGSDSLPYPLISNVNFDGGGPVPNTTDYANAALGRQGHTATGVTIFGLAVDYYTNSYFNLNGSPPWPTHRLLTDTDTNGESLASIADLLGIPFGLHEFGTPPKQVDPEGSPWTFGTQYFNYITNFMSARVAAGKPNLDCIYYDGQGQPDGSTDITSPIGQDPTTGPLISSTPVNTYVDFRVPLYQAFFDAINGN